METKKEKLEKVAIYGDSISTTSYGDGGYESALKQGLQLEQIYNFAVSSSGLAANTPHNMVGILDDENIPNDVELILVWHGSNDWYWGTEIGNNGSKEHYTFWGGIDFVINRLREKNPLAKIAWVTPIYRHEKPNLGTNCADAYETLNSKGYTLLDYYMALEHASKRYGFSLIDMRILCNIHRYNADYYLEDSVHPNANGYKIISKVLLSEIGRLYGGD